MCRSLEYSGMMPKRAKGPSPPFPGQNWLGSALKRYFVHSSSTAAKRIPESFIPQEALCKHSQHLQSETEHPGLQYNTHSKDTPILVPSFPSMALPLRTSRAESSSQSGTTEPRDPQAAPARTCPQCVTSHTATAPLTLSLSSPGQPQQGTAAPCRGCTCPSAVSALRQPGTNT